MIIFIKAFIIFNCRSWLAQHEEEDFCQPIIQPVNEHKQGLTADISMLNVVIGSKQTLIRSCESAV